MTPALPVMIVTGPVGVGKTAVAIAISALLDQAEIRHAMIDMDHLRWCYPASADDPFEVALGLRNLAAVAANYRSAGAERLVVADVIESRADLARYRDAVPGAAIVVIRLRARLETIVERLTARELGAGLEWHQRRAAELIEVMERARVEDVLVDTEGKSAAEAALEAVTRAGWLGGSALPCVPGIEIPG